MFMLLRAKRSQVSIVPALAEDLKAFFGAGLERIWNLKMPAEWKLQAEPTVKLISI